MAIIVVLGIIVFIVVAFVVSNYNSLVVSKNKVKDQWAQIDVVLKRRSDLIPNLIETVKGYTKHENSTLKEVVEARNKAVEANTPEEKMKAEGELSNTLGKLFALTEAYPDLKANTNFLDLQANLKETEDKITYARQFYNDSVLSYQNKLEVFPSNIIASLFKFKSEEFFKIADEEKEVPKVKF